MPAGGVSDAYLRAWEYEPAADIAWPAPDGDTVKLWRTRRPDLAPPELWVGDRESIDDSRRGRGH
jgi:hypothetical protein